MGGKVDLHIHSNKSSDGSLPPGEIVRLAERHGLEAIAISDHDSVAAYPEVLQEAEKHGVEVIPSLELTTVFDDREFHLLLPFVNWESEEVGSLVKEVADRRLQEARERVGKLRDVGFDIEMKEVLEETEAFPPLGVTIALTLLKKNFHSPPPSLRKYFKPENLESAPYLFYEDYFMAGKPACVPRRNLHLVDVLKRIPETGAVPVLAHPGAYFQNVTKEDLVLLGEEGIQGLEVYTSYHDPEQTEYYRALAEELGLVATAGSDFHGEIKPRIPFGYLEQGDYGIVRELKSRRH